MTWCYGIESGVFAFVDAGGSIYSIVSFRSGLLILEVLGLLVVFCATVVMMLPYLLLVMRLELSV